MFQKEKKWFRFLFFLCFLGVSLSSSKAQNTGVIGKGNASGVTISTSDDVSASRESLLDSKSFIPNLNATSRFLGQATFGADYETIENTAELGVSNWLDEQFATAGNLDMEVYIQEMTDMVRDSMIFYDASQEELDDLRPSSTFWRYAWTQYVMTSPDALRARVALALSEIFVLSEEPDFEFRPMVLADYYKMLLQHSFGNYRDLIYDMSVHPAMGLYLTHVNNPKTNLAQNRFPDENYAREIMQLFSIGLYQLNLDGTYVLDEDGLPIATYGHQEIAGLAKVFTGLSWGTRESFGMYGRQDEDFQAPMQMFDDWHEPGEKQLFNDIIIPDRNPIDGMADVNEALDHLFNHQNVGPFIAARLIQRLVTSNPSPEYVARVAMAFNDNGEGVRGDFTAVIRAILIDEEARDCALMNDPHHGMLREPLVRHTNLLKAFNAASPSGRYNNKMYIFQDQTAQRPLASPTVFNFFSPDFQPIGPVEQAGLVAPEFQITNAQTILGYASMVDRWTRDENKAVEAGNIYNGITYYPHDKYVVKLDLTDEMLMSEDDKINELIERYNLLLMHGNMAEDTRAFIREAALQVPIEQAEDRIRMALFLVMMSPEYLIMR